MSIFQNLSYNFYQSYLSFLYYLIISKLILFDYQFKLINSNFVNQFDLITITNTASINYCHIIVINQNDLKMNHDKTIINIYYLNNRYFQKILSTNFKKMVIMFNNRIKQL